MVTGEVPRHMGPMVLDVRSGVVELRGYLLVSDRVLLCVSVLLLPSITLGGLTVLWQYLQGAVPLRHCLIILLLSMQGGCLDSTDKLRHYLTRLKRFPDESRKAILISSLQTPSNYKHLTQLCQPPVPLVEHTIDKDTCTLVATIIKLDPSLNVQWLPGIVYPFAKLFKKDLLAQFQISLTFLYNWAVCWFKDYPTPCIEITDFMAKELPQLANAVRGFGSPFSALVWPMFLVNFSDILNKSDWLQLFDFVLINPDTPWLLICCITQLLQSLTQHLVKAPTLEKMHGVLRKQRYIDIGAVIKNGVALSNRQEEYFSKLYRDRVFPLPKPQYPILTFVQRDPNISRIEVSPPNLEQLETIQKLITRYEVDKRWQPGSKGYRSQAEYQRLQKGLSPPTKTRLGKDKQSSGNNR